MVSRNGALERTTMFGTVISRFGDIAWPARSPELLFISLSWLQLGFSALLTQLPLCTEWRGAD